MDINHLAHLVDTVIITIVIQILHESEGVNWAKLQVRCNHAWWNKITSGSDQGKLVWVYYICTGILYDRGYQFVIHITGDHGS